VTLNADGELQGARANPMYWFYRGGTPMFDVEDDPGAPGGHRLAEEDFAGDFQSQYPIVDDLPGREGYSPYWEIVRVEVPSDYEPNRIKSLATLREAIDSGDFDLVYTGEALHCPIVDWEATLERGVSARDRMLPRARLWFRQFRTYCYLFERPDGFLGSEGFEMPAARVEQGTGEIGDAEIDRDVLSIPGMDLFFPRTEVVYPSGSEFEIFPTDGILTEFLPGDVEYSPLARINYYRVVPGFPFGGYTSLSDIDPSLAEESDPVEFRDLPVRGTISPCTGNDDCDDGLDPPLSCNDATGYCDSPPVGYGQYCGPGIARCDHTESDLFPMGLACTSLRIQVERYCYRRCDWQEDDTDPGPGDSRCGSIPGMTCVRTLRVVEDDAGVCMRECNALRGAPETAAGNNDCELTTGEEGFAAGLDGDIYGPAAPVPVPFDLDDKPTEGRQRGPDDPEPDGRVDLVEGTTCLTSIRDLCAWPDSRLDALRAAGAAP
jgi:hypothetical protein